MDNHFIPFSGEEIGIVPLNYSVAFITNAVCGLPPGAPFITRGLYTLSLIQRSFCLAIDTRAVSECVAIDTIVSGL